MEQGVEWQPRRLSDTKASVDQPLGAVDLIAFHPRLGDCLREILSHYPWIVFLGFSFWRKMVVQVPAHRGLRFPPLGEENNARRRVRNLGLSGKLRSLRSILPKEHRFLTERIPLSQKSWEETTGGEVLPGLGGFVTGLILANQVDCVKIMVTELQFDLHNTFWVNELDWLRWSFVQCAVGRSRILQMILSHSYNGEVVDRWFINHAPHFGNEGLPLFTAARAGCLESTSLMLSYGAGARAQDDSRTVPLHMATSAAVAELLLGNGAQVDDEDSQGCTALFFASNAEVAQTLLDSGADVARMDIGGRTPLHCVKSLGVATALVKAGASINRPDDEGRSPLCGQSPSISRYLLTEGAYLESSDQFGNTPLFHAASAGNLETLKLLVEEFGAKCSFKVNRKRQTVLHHAATLEIVEYLVDTCKLSAHAKDKAGRTPLHTVCSIIGIPESVCDALLMRGASLTVRSDNGFTPLHSAAQAGSIHFMRSLLDHGADVNAVTPVTLETPLHVLSPHGSNNTKVVLLEHGASSTAVDSEGRVPRCSRKRVDMFQFDLYVDSSLDSDSDDCSTEVVDDEESTDGEADAKGEEKQTPLE